METYALSIPVLLVEHDAALQATVIYRNRSIHI